MSETATSTSPAPTKRERPLSPHLQIYKPQISSVMSILHRITGIGLALGAVALTLCLASAAAGPLEYEQMQRVMGSPVGIILLMGWSWALFYHLTNGIRHLVWDAGYGWDLESVHTSAFVSIGATTFLTLLAWIFGLALMA